MSQSVSLLLKDETAKNSLLSQVEDLYGMKVASFEPVRTVMRLETNQGLYALKAVSYREGKLNFIVSAMEHAYRSGFTKIALIIPDQQGRYCFKHQDHLYFLTDWIDGEQCDTRVPGHLTSATQSLAEFHHHARGLLSPPGSQFKVMWDRWPEMLARRTSSFEKYMAAAGSSKSRFCTLWKKQHPYYLSQAQRSLRLLHHSSYPMLAEESKKLQTFVHRDVAGRNFIISPSQGACMIDFDYCRFDLRLTDLQRLLERSMKKWDWDIEVAQFIMSKYNSVNRLRREELPVLFSFMTFPQKFWRLSERYFDKRRNWTEGKFMEHLEDIIDSQRSRELFLQRFERRYCQRQEG